MNPFTKKLNKKAQEHFPHVVTYVLSIVLGLFVIAVLVFSVAISGGQMITVNTQGLNSTTSANIINNMTAGVNSFSTMSPVIWIVTAIVLVLMILIGGLGYLFLKNSGTDLMK
jgi:hypothetical protein